MLYSKRQIREALRDKFPNLQEILSEGEYYYTINLILDLIEIKKHNGKIFTLDDAINMLIINFNNPIYREFKQEEKLVKKSKAYILSNVHLSIKKFIKLVKEMLHVNDFKINIGFSDETGCALIICNLVYDIHNDFKYEKLLDQEEELEEKFYLYLVESKHSIDILVRFNEYAKNELYNEINAEYEIKNGDINGNLRTYV